MIALQNLAKMRKNKTHKILIVLIGVDRRQSLRTVKFKGSQLGIRSLFLPSRLDWMLLKFLTTTLHKGFLS